MRLTTYEKKNYVLDDKEDLVILKKIKQVEKKKLSQKEKEIVKLIRTQLKDDWRGELIKYLDGMLRGR